MRSIEPNYTQPLLVMRPCPRQTQKCFLKLSVFYLLSARRFSGMVEFAFQNKYCHPSSCRQSWSNAAIPLGTPMQTFLGSRTLPVCTALWRLPVLEMLVCTALVFWESRCAQPFGAFQFSNSLDVSRSGASYFHQMLVCAAFRRHRFSRALLLALSRARTFSDRNTI